MVRVEVWSQGGRIERFQVTGHAGYAEHGQDIVCAGVSALVQTTLKALKTLVDSPVILTKRRLGGDIRCYLRQAGDMVTEQQSQLLVRTLALGLREMEESYDQYVKLIEHAG